MSAYAYWPYIVRLPPTGYDNDNPVSAARVFVMRSNLQMHCNLFAQHRINWVAQDEGSLFVGALAPEVDVTRRWAQDFELTWLRPDYPCGLQICVALLRGSGGDDEVTASCRIAPGGSPAGGGTTLWAGALASEGEDDTQVLEGFLVPEGGPWSHDMFVQHAVEEEGEARGPFQSILRFEIDLYVPAGSSGAISELKVREFAWQS